MDLFNLRKRRSGQQAALSPLVACLRDEIEANGPIGIDRFIETALRHPLYGYDRQSDTSPDENANPATAPEISQLFGEMIAVWLLDAWNKAGKPARFALLELGPERGTMMLDIMRSLQGEEAFRSGARLFLMERNETLRAAQAEKLRAFSPTHIDDMAALPDMPLFCVSNEFFHGLPLRQFVRTPRGWRERLVGVEGPAFVFREGPETPLPPVDADAAVNSFAVSTVYEMSDTARDIARQIAARIARHGGAALMIDYGYDRPQGINSLTALRDKQFREELFARPGKAEIAADVDFAALAVLGRAAGLAVSGPIGQGDFLRLMGIAERAKTLKQRASFLTKRKIDKDLRRLTHGGEMGVAFRVLSYGGGTTKQPTE